MSAVSNFTCTLSIFPFVQLVIALCLVKSCQKRIISTAMSAPLQEVVDLLLAYYASKGRFPRPKDVTQEQIDTMNRLVASISVNVPIPIDQRRRDDLAATIHQLDQQVNIYEDPDLLVSLLDHGYIVCII